MNGAATMRKQVNVRGTGGHQRPNAVLIETKIYIDSHEEEKKEDIR
jgi:hypothetical protein